MLGDSWREFGRRWRRRRVAMVRDQLGPGVLAGLLKANCWKRGESRAKRTVAGHSKIKGRQKRATLDWHGLKKSGLDGTDYNSERHSIPATPGLSGWWGRSTTPTSEVRNISHTHTTGKRKNLRWNEWAQNQHIMHLYAHATRAVKPNPLIKRGPG